jgi:uncharacterized protein YndB with AHSA1/START domain
VAAPAEQVWEIVRRVEELPYWLAGVRMAEQRGPEGFGRRQRLYGARGGGGVDVEATVIAYREPTLIAWRYAARRIGGGPWQPARPDELHVQLTPEGPRTRVRMYAVRRAGLVGGLLVRLGFAGGWRLRDDLTRSLMALASLTAAPAPRRLE